MWAAFVGFFAGRAIGNGQVPDSVKQRRWDAQQARKSEARGTYGKRGEWSPEFRRTVAVILAIGAVVVLAVVILR